jgi:hypothetical protein
MGRGTSSSDFNTDKKRRIAYYSAGHNNVLKKMNQGCCVVRYDYIFTLINYDCNEVTTYSNFDEKEFNTKKKDILKKGAKYNFVLHRREDFHKNFSKEKLKMGKMKKKKMDDIEDTNENTIEQSNSDSGEEEEEQEENQQHDIFPSINELDRNLKNPIVKNDSLQMFSRNTWNSRFD